MLKKFSIFLLLSTAIHAGLLLVFQSSSTTKPANMSASHKKYKNIQLAILEYAEYYHLNQPAEKRASTNTRLKQANSHVSPSSKTFFQGNKTDRNNAQQMDFSKKVEDQLSQPEKPDLPEGSLDTQTSSSKITNDTVISTYISEINDQDSLIASSETAQEAQTEKLDALLDQTFWHHFSYPRIAVKYGWQGLVTVGVRIEANGALSNIHIIESSGYPALDNAALKSIKRIAVLEGAGEWLHGLHYDTQLPILYKLMDS